MLLFEIRNPSDPYTIEASSLDVAAMTAILIGQGEYGFKSLDGGESVPMFAFGGGDEWSRKHFSEDLMEMSNRVMDTKLSQVADCLDSVVYGDAQDRGEFFIGALGMGRDAFLVYRLAHQDKNRSSMNDIGERAYRMAATLRQSIQDGISTLQ